ncbi:GntR family transcriptional regulator [Psychrosphaera ytuae]|nr:GntR family transcriptional regulator [Psychrosphaera ytuae]
MTQIVTKKVSEQVASQLEAMIIDGSFAAGERLASERHLAEQYGVSRPSIRDAIKQLEAKGLVTRKQGGGTFVSKQLDAPFAAPLFDLLANNPESHYDLLEFRCALESVVAYYAALRGEKTELNHIEVVFNSINEIDDNDLDAASDAIVEFYLAIADAAQNVLLIHLLRGVKDLLRHNIKENLMVFKDHKDIRQQLNEHRAKLMKAILEGQPDTARQASGQHLAFIEQSLLKLDQDKDRLSGSVRRLLSSQ